MKCSTKKRIWVEKTDTKCENTNQIDKMDFAGMGGRTFGVVAVGRLVAEKESYGYMNEFDCLFKVECFKRAEMLDKEGYVPQALTLPQRNKIEAFEKSN